MIDLKNKKIIGLTIVSIIIFIASIFLYKQNSSNAFKEEYMTEIFTEESNDNMEYDLSLIHISEPTRPPSTSRMPSSA